MSQPPPTAWYTAGAPPPASGCVRAYKNVSLGWEGNALVQIWPVFLPFFFFFNKPSPLPTLKFDPKEIAQL